MELPGACRSLLQARIRQGDHPPGGGHPTSDPQICLAFRRRDEVWIFAVRVPIRSIADFTEAIRLDPEIGWVFFGRGRAWSIQELTKSIRLSCYTEAITLRDDNHRDGEEIRLNRPTRVCELTKWKEPLYLDTWRGVRRGRQFPDRQQLANQANSPRAARADKVRGEARPLFQEKAIPATALLHRPFRKWASPFVE